MSDTPVTDRDAVAEPPAPAPGWVRRLGPTLAVLVAICTLVGMVLAFGQQLVHLAFAAAPWVPREQAAAQHELFRRDLATAREAQSAEYRALDQRLTRVETSSAYQDRLLWQVATGMGLRVGAPPASGPAAGPGGATPPAPGPP